MDKKEKDCGLLIAVLLAGVALGGVAGVVVLSLFYPVFQSDKWAAWVQAIGSIGAIAAAIYIMNRQVKAQEKMRATEKRMNFLGTVKLLQEGGKQVKGYVNHCFRFNNGSQRDLAAPLEVWSNVFQEIDITEPALIKITTPIANIRFQTVRIIKIFSAIEDGSATLQGQKQTLIDCCELIDKSVQICADRM